MAEEQYTTEIRNTSDEVYKALMRSKTVVRIFTTAQGKIYGLITSVLGDSLHIENDKGKASLVLKDHIVNVVIKDGE